MVKLSGKLPEGVIERTKDQLNTLFETSGAAPITFAQRATTGADSSAGKTSEIPVDLMASQRGVVV